MKKIVSLLVSLLIVTGLVACSNDKKSEVVGNSYKVGVGSYTTISTTDYNEAESKNGRVQYNTTYAVLVLDSEDKIVSLTIDTAQNSATVEANGVVTVSEDTRTKKEKGSDYNMGATSPIGKEWFEQIASLEEYTIGKSVTEILAVVSGEGDLETTVTVDISDILKAIEVANANVVVVEDAVSYGSSSISEWKVSSYNAETEKAGSAQINTTYAVVVLDAEGNIAYTAIDAAQFTSAVDAKSVITVASDLRTKKEKGSDYNMGATSPIGKEWFEQIASLEEYALGKTVAEMLTVVSGEGDLETSVTIDITSYLTVIEKAVKEVIIVK